MSAQAKFSSRNQVFNMPSTQGSSENGQHFIQIDSPKTSETNKFASSVPKLTLQWRDLTFKASSKNPQTKKVEEKVILDGVSGYAKPGEFVVIVGPSGAGKSTLMDCISGRKSATEGTITVNGEPFTKKLNRVVSYVMQHDLFCQTITVREHLMIQARLRMGKKYSKEEYSERVDTVMEELGLTKCRDTLIGGDKISGISGGECKRLAFATEILTNPSILFVDEPTSGLDSFMAETVVRLLQQLARVGRTVIVTIHQPSSEIFALFDKLYLLADGASIYLGKASESVEYFASLGYQCPPYLNPSDYYMRQLAVLDKESDKAGVERVEELKQAWKRREQETLTSDPAQNNNTAFGDGGDDDSEYENTRIGIFGQIAVLIKRDFLRTVRDPLAFKSNLFVSIFLSIIVGLIYLQLDLDQTGVQNFAGALFFLATWQTFGAANRALTSVPLELPIIQREYSGGLYKLISWYLAKNISELPMQILLPVIFFIPTYFLIGFGGGFKVFIGMQVVLILIDSAAVGLGYMVSCITRRVDIAPIIGTMVILPFMLFSGLLINSDDTPDYFVWIQYMSPINYGNEALMKIFWGQIDSIPCDDEDCSVSTGQDVLRKYNMESRSALGSVLLVLVVNIGFRIVGFVALYFGLKKKKSM